MDNSHFDPDTSVESLNKYHYPTCLQADDRYHSGDCKQQEMGKGWEGWHPFPYWYQPELWCCIFQSDSLKADLPKQQLPGLTVHILSSHHEYEPESMDTKK